MIALGTIAQAVVSDKIGMTQCAIAMRMGSMVKSHPPLASALTPRDVMRPIPRTLLSPCPRNM